MVPPLSFVVPQPPPPICGVPVVKESCGLAVQQLQVCARLVPAVRLRAIDMRPPKATLPQRSPVMAFPSPVGWWTDPRFTLPVTFESGIGHLEWPHNPVIHRIKEGKITEGVPRELPEDSGAAAAFRARETLRSAGSGRVSGTARGAEADRRCPSTVPGRGGCSGTGSVRAVGSGPS